MRRITLQETDSTNRYLMDLAKQGRDNDEDIIVATAEYQTAGRGCDTNSWESEQGRNLLFSILIHPHHILPRQQYAISMAEAIAIRDAIADVVGDKGDKVTIKWPNDIYYDDRKLSGTLISLNLDSHGMKDLVIGTGINVNQKVFYSDAPNPISILQIIGRETPVTKLLDDIIARFQTNYAALSDDEGLRTIIQRYHTLLYRKQGFYKYQDKQGLFEAEIQEVRPDGTLILIRRDGTISHYAFKEVQFII